MNLLHYLLHSIVTRNGDSLETRTVLIEIFVMLKFSEWSKTSGIIFKINMAFSDGNRQFACDFCANPDIKTLIWFNLQSVLGKLLQQGK